MIKFTYISPWNEGESWYIKQIFRNHFQKFMSVSTAYKRFYRPRFRCLLQLSWFCGHPLSIHNTSPSCWQYIYSKKLLCKWLVWSYRLSHISLPNAIYTIFMSIGRRPPCCRQLDGSVFHQFIRQFILKTYMF